MEPSIAFIGGGNMATAILRGLLRAGRAASDFLVIEPQPAARERLAGDFGVAAQAAADARLATARSVVWAVKPQSFREAASACAPHVGKALQISVMAGVRCASLAQATGAARVVRAMPNTPALIGEGIAGLYANEAVDAAARAEAEALLAPTGRLLWVAREPDLDTVTALSGSGPAYFFYFVEALVKAGTEMGLPEAQARELALATCRGAAVQGLSSAEPLALLRERVTSKGGTTHAALTSMEADGVAEAIERAAHAAAQRARELGDALHG
ncbi:MAG: pyrroline-5-carboxylate reductase [Paucibacter sp.]|nr:pyrroline-5-carboxylate reductase [Roseateles sp.]